MKKMLLDKMEETIKTKVITISEKNLLIQGQSHDENEIRNYSYYVKKIQESTTDEDSSKYYKTLLYHYLKIE